MSVPASAERHAGDSVRYEAENAQRVFLWTQATEGQEHLVIWNAVTRAGSITATNYNDGQKACWNENLDHDDC